VTIFEFFGRVGNGSLTLKFYFNDEGG